MPGSIVSEPEFASDSILGNIGAPLRFGDEGSNIDWEENETNESEHRNWEQDAADAGAIVDSAFESGTLRRSEKTVGISSRISRDAGNA